MSFQRSRRDCSLGLSAVLSLAAVLSAACGDMHAGPSDGAGRPTEGQVGAAASAVTGGIGNHVIQIDGPPNGADLYANLGVPLNAQADVDWVADSVGNTGTNCLGSDAIATCVEPNVTGAVGGKGHWNGLRIVDGIGNADQNIFLNGGKENDTSTWNIGPGSVGSSKYDITEAYLASNSNRLFFGMERRGNNGTTAFDFEFNALAPVVTDIPNRSVGDVLFTFEVNGSGNNGSVTPHIFVWNGSTYVEQPSLPANTFASTNQVATPAGPWGYVNSRGDWVLGNIPQFQFAEAVVPFGPGGITLPGLSSCGGRAFVQVRTRSSATATSDLKDTTHVFAFTFGNPTATATLTPNCNSQLDFSVTNVVDPNGNPIANPSCSWTFTNGPATLASNVCTGTLAGVPSGNWTGTVVVSDPTSTCSTTITTASAGVFAPLHVDLTLSPGQSLTCPAVASSNVVYTAAVTGGSGSISSFEWTGICSSETGSTCTIPPPSPAVCASSTSSLHLKITDANPLCGTATSENETYSVSTVTTVNATDIP